MIEINDCENKMVYNIEKIEIGKNKESDEWKEEQEVEGEEEEIGEWE